jgi:DNA-binding transcriptional ArsR family regulator
MVQGKRGDGGASDGIIVSPCANCFFPSILSPVEKYSAQLNNVFHSLADPTRRAVLARLGRGPASISELARPTGMALPSFLKHIRSLEGSGLIRTRKEGRVRTCVLEKQTFAVVDTWLSTQRDLWEGRTERLEQFVISTQAKEKSK